MSNVARDKEPGPVFAMLLPSDPGGVGLSASVRALESELATAGWEAAAGEGKLAVDVVETAGEVMVVATVAGAALERIEIYLHNDLLTIRGERPSPLANMPGAQPVHEECFWGRFSRTIVLPCHVKADLARAEYRSGVLTIIIPKRSTDARVPVRIVEE